ncbi:MAG: Eco57I restriction-modification methylase domain-containing protein [Polyangia bacterium]
MADRLATLSAGYCEHTGDAHKKSWGQFFTGPQIAAFMASLFEAPRRGAVRILDPGAGTGVLGISAADEILRQSAARVLLTAVEKEPGAAKILRKSLAAAQERWGERLEYSVVEDDFLDLGRTNQLANFDYALGNPPYFKMSPSDARGGDAPNAYARFIEVALGMLADGGQLCFIVPRSFSSGCYFKNFRRRLHSVARLDRVHVFGSRTDAFRQDGVLQENIIVLYKKTQAPSASVVISSSQGESDLGERGVQNMPRTRVIAEARDSSVFLPTNARDLGVMDRVAGWTGTLASMGLDVSTGPVVPFRAERFLRQKSSTDTVPLLWLQHVRPDQVTWPLDGDFRKPEHIKRSAGTKRLVPNRTYVLVRRFSAKEDARRLVAGPYLAGSLPGDFLGLENHVNFIHRPGGELSPRQAIGLAALFNSELIDTYFRISSGNTQVSATELRALPLPSAAILDAIAARLSRGQSADAAVNAVLGQE